MRRLRRWGYPALPRVIVGDPSLAPPEVRWRTGLRPDRPTAARLARRLGTSAVRRLDDGSLGGAPLIVVVGVGSARVGQFAGHSAERRG